MILSLAAVVAMILGLAWMTRRMQNLRGAQGGELRVRASLAVGIKERVVIVEAAGQQFLIGVAPGQVSILKSLGPVATIEAEPGEAAVAPPSGLRESFAYQLRQLLGR
ncbi:MAG: flagellar biosynthetic protein FliO [Panacagrimonas sp.]